MLSLVMLTIGFALLVWGADKFVAGAAALARRLGVSALLIGLTIVAFGTSAPELAVSVTAALKGANEIAVGNVLGSNLFNLLMVAGLSAVVCPLMINQTLLRRDWPLSIAASIVLFFMLRMGGGLSRIDGVILLVGFAAVTGLQITSALREKKYAGSAMEQEEASETSFLLILVNIVLGMACIIIGGQLSVDGASGLARLFGWSETLIGLTIVAFGTSLPELVTSIAAARRGETDIAMGNVVGSNLFNILLILGTSAAITPIAVQPTAPIDCLTLILVNIIFYLPTRKGKLGRLPGLAMVCSYIVYTVYLVLR